MSLNSKLDDLYQRLFKAQMNKDHVECVRLQGLIELLEKQEARTHESTS